MDGANFQREAEPKLRSTCSSGAPRRAIRSPHDAGGTAGFGVPCHSGDGFPRPGHEQYEDRNRRQRQASGGGQSGEDGFRSDGFDFSRMVKRTDVDYVFTRQSGTVGIFFYSEAPVPLPEGSRNRLLSLVTILTPPANWNGWARGSPGMERMEWCFYAIQPIPSLRPAPLHPAFKPISTAQSRELFPKRYRLAGPAAWRVQRPQLPCFVTGCFPHRILLPAQPVHAKRWHHSTGNLFQ